MMRAISPLIVLAFSTTLALANEQSFLCTVTETCEFANQRNTDCPPLNGETTFSLTVEHTEHLVGTAKIAMGGVETVYDRHSAGHGIPPEPLGSVLNDTPTTQAQQDVEPQPLAAYAYSSDDGRDLTRAVGWSNGGPDTVTLFFDRDGARMSLTANCTCIGETEC